MVIPPNMKPKQEMAPLGGFKAFDVRRKIRPGRLSSFAMIGLGIAAMGYGHYQASIQRQTNRDRKNDKQERRAYILPFLQVERDMQFILEERKQLELEEYLMRDYEDWEVGKNHFHSGAFIIHHPKTPTFARRGII